MRVLTSALKVRFRVAVAEKQFDTAIRTAKTMFALSRHLGKHPTLIGNLVGMACAMVTIGPVEEMLQQPSCPNLYWALTELPAPLVEIHHGIQGERVLDPAELAIITDRRAMTAAELDQVVKAFTELYDMMTLKEGLAAPTSSKPAKEEPEVKGKKAPKKLSQPEDLLNEWLKVTARDPARLRAARKRLIDAGLAEKKVASFPALQVLLLDEKREYEERRDEETKGIQLPYWQREAFLTKARPQSEDVFLFRPLVPICTRMRNYQARVDQRIALLRTVEALRLYAAAHSGRLPDKLTDVPVPLPIDPVIGKPFSYKKDGNKATLKGTTPLGQEKNPYFNIRFEVTIKS
jgi:hypothetical protein